MIKYICSTHLPLAHNSLAAGVPVPQQHGAVLAAADDVAVAGVVTLRPGDRRWGNIKFAAFYISRLSPRQTGDNSVMPEHNLTDLGRLCAVNSETRVPESSSNHKPSTDYEDLKEFK